MTEETMRPETWRAFCQSIMSMKGPPMEALGPARVEFSFRCDRCAKEWKTGMKLDGVKHIAIQNKCGGTWRAVLEVKQ